MRKSVENSTGNPTLRYLSDRPQINIEFQDLSYTVPQGRKGQFLFLILLHTRNFCYLDCNRIFSKMFVYAHFRENFTGALFYNLRLIFHASSSFFIFILINFMYVFTN